MLIEQNLASKKKIDNPEICHVVRVDWSTMIALEKAGGRVRPKMEKNLKELVK